MKITPNSIKLTAGSVAVATLLCLPVSTPAAPVTLTVNSSLSSITLAGNAFTLNYQQQAAGSLLDAFSGTIVANEVGGVLTFSGSSSITGVMGGPWATSPYPGGPYAGNYGVTNGPAFVPPYGIVTLNGTYTGLTLDLTGGSVQNALPSSGLVETWTAGTLIWGANTSGYGPQGGTSSMVGVTTAGDTSATAVTWDGTTLTLPVQFHTIGSNRYEDWSGVLVATVVVPEPTSLGLALLGLGLLAAKKARRNS